MMAGWIYGLQGRDPDTGELVLKLGRTGRTPTERGAELNVAPRYRRFGPYRLAWKLPAADMNRVEAGCHRMLRDCRIHGELFRVDPETGRQVAEAVAGAASRRRRFQWLPLVPLPWILPRGFLLRLAAVAALLLLARELL